MKILFATLLATGVMTATIAAPPPSVTLRKQRPPELDVSAYKQVAVGDIVGPSGYKTEQSLDLTDALTAQLFNAKTLEVVDRNALENIMGSQKKGDLEIIDEATKQFLSKKLKNALLITGRMQSQKLEQKLIYDPQSSTSCPNKYFYQIKGDIVVQLRILDVKTGKMIFTNPVTQPVDARSKEDCSQTALAKLDETQVYRDAIKGLGDKVAKLVTPYEVATLLGFSEPGLFSSPFKELQSAATYLQMNNMDAALAILKNYTESKAVKDKNKDDAWYNYGVGLLYAGKYDEAKKALQMSVSLQTKNLANVTLLLKMIDEEEQVARKMEAQAVARQKMLEQPEEPAVEEKPAKPGKPTIAVPVKRKKG